ncbi:MAG: OmpA family protein [Propioniciclava sp.]|uniref:OmpA family protein n=1 Tax=Propioniciclava sp. TaxID=2038686 RepID=UPI0039E706EA
MACGPRRLATFGLIAALALTGCTPGTPTPSPTSAGLVTPSGATQDAATRLVREGAPALPQVIATATFATDHDYAGCELAFFSVTATDASTVVTWGPRCGDREPATIFTRESPRQEPPALRVGDDTYKVTQFQDITYSVAATLRQNLSPWGGFQPEARPSSALYAPLPAGTTSVEITSPAFTAPVTVPVTRPDAHAGGSTAIPILARATLQGRSTGHGDTPILASVHGIRRVPGATAVYYSLTTPDGGDQRALGTLGFYGNNTTYSPNWMALGFMENFANASAAFDHDRDLALGQLGRNGSGDYGVLASGYKAEWPLRDATQPLVLVAYLPELPASTHSIDLLLGGRLILQDLPVSDGAMTPVSSDQFPVLGTGWPTIPEDMLTSLPAEESTNVTSPLTDIVTDGKITHAGQTLELNTEVLFDYNEATLTPAANGVINQAATDITAAGSAGEITITGHTDDTGTDSYNLDLSERRARAVADALRPHLPAAITMTVDGKGEAEPIYDNGTDTGKAANRRVTITLPG